ncbi:hypothetical protein [Saccharopolyspora hattusasensis]|uniref:hypothetical protein n=1 Tax=Saccharopolyspora hattusasensis TaxID=1128679 RepID=UPI003D996B2A
MPQWAEPLENPQPAAVGDPASHDIAHALTLATPGTRQVTVVEAEPNRLHV